MAFGETPPSGLGSGDLKQLLKDRRTSAYPTCAQVSSNLYGAWYEKIYLLLLNNKGAHQLAHQSDQQLCYSLPVEYRI